MGEAAFFYYNPEPNTDHRQHGHFSQQPSAGHFDASTPKYHYQPYNPPMMAYGHQQMMYPQIPIPHPPILQKPVLVSPRPMQHKSGFLASSEIQNLSLDTECNTPDLCVYPSTPPLSVTSSASSTSPSNCGALPTPVTTSYVLNSNIEGVKEGCEGDVKNEILAGGDFARSGSPLLTPGTSFSKARDERRVDCKVEIPKLEEEL